MTYQGEPVALIILAVLFILTQGLNLLVFVVDAYFFSLPVDWVDMDEPITDPPSKWPYIVLFYPVLRELETTMRTTFLSLTKLEYPADRYRVIAIPNSNDAETIASLRRLATEFDYLEILEIPPTSERSATRCLSFEFSSRSCRSSRSSLWPSPEYFFFQM